MRRGLDGVVVTGLGAVTPMGLGVARLWEGLRAGRSGIRGIRQFDAGRLPIRIAGEVPDYQPELHFEPRELPRLDRYSQFALLAAGEALEEAGGRSGWSPERVGVSIGSGLGGLGTLSSQHQLLLEAGPRKVSAVFIPKAMHGAAASLVAIRHGFQGPFGAPSTACASGAQAIVEGCRAIALGEADLVLAGGSDAPIQPLALAGFSALRALSGRNEEPELACRPFDEARDGFVLGEGAGVLALESEASARRRGARVYARVSGYGVSLDAHHITAPQADGRGVLQAMRRALDSAGLTPEMVDYVNAHATGTPQGDLIEASAIHSLFGGRPPAVSSTKSMVGHLMGASGAVEAIATLLCLREQWLHPTLNLTKLDERIHLDCVPNTGRPCAVRHALSNSFGFGGLNVCLAFSHPSTSGAP